MKSPQIYCERCGAQIEDIEIHKSATLCETCRIKSRKKVAQKASSYAVPYLNKYLETRGWPNHVKPMSIPYDIPEIYGQLGLDPDTESGIQRMKWVLSNAMRQIETPDGKIYRRQAKSSKIFIKIKKEDV